NSSQNGTEPSAKSIQTGFLAGSEQALPAAASGAAGRAEAPRPTTASSTSREIFFTRPRHLVAGKAEARPLPRLRFRLLRLVEGSVDLGDLLGLSLFLRRVLLAEVGSAAEVEAEAREARAVAAVAADLLQRRE